MGITDTAAANRLVEENLPLVLFALKKLLRLYPNLHSEQDELIQIGRLALVKASRAFDPDRGIRFSTYACRAIFRVMCRYAGCPSALLCASLRQRHGLPRTGLSTLMALWDSHDGQAALDKADDVRKLHRLLQGLTLRQRRLLRLAFWEGLSRHEIGERLNVSHLAARRMLRRTLARLYWSWVCGSPEVKQSIVQEAV